MEEESTQAANQNMFAAATQIQSYWITKNTDTGIQHYSKSMGYITTINKY